MQNVVLARPRLQWGDRINLVVLVIFQVIAVIVLLSVPFFVDNLLEGSSQYSIQDLWLYFYTPFLLGLIFFTSSIWVFVQRRIDPVGQVYSLFATATAVSLFCLFDFFTSQRLFSLWVLSAALSGGALINLALIFPEQAKINLNHPSSRFLAYLPSVVFILLSFLMQFLSGYRNYSATILLLELVFVILAFLFLFSSILIRRVGSSSALVREQSRIILWGCIISVAPITAGYLIQQLISDINLSPLLLIPIAAFPISLTYTMLRYRISKSQELMKQAIIYGSLLVIVSGSYALLVSGLGVLIGTQMISSHPVLVGIVVFFIALLIYPIREGLQTRLDTAFNRGGAIYQASLQSFSHELTRLYDVTGILDILRSHIEKSLSPSRTLVYMIDETKNYYVSVPDPDGTYSSEIHFARSSSLVEVLNKNASPIHIGDSGRVPEELLVDQARIAILEAELFVPILGQSGMLGWLALGMRRSGEPYSLNDIHYLESLCDQASLALERSQVVAALEKRIREMDTITKVAEQINQKMVLGDLLDMFYNETRNLVPTVDFRITLRPDSSEDFYHVFYVSDNKRSIRRENQPFLAQHSLETVVIESQRPIVTLDYAGECRRRGVTPESKQIHAWMSVPLISGLKTIGAVCIGSRDPGVIYTPEQVNLLQAVADLVAGAIVKTRLLDESQKQARQMAALNDLTRSLTSTLELKPLLNRIMDGAVEILDCEAGSLLLVDESSGESVFEVAIGPVGDDLIGKRLPAGAGLVGKALDSKHALIENDVRSSEDWFNADQKTGFSSKDLLVAPLVVKERAIGVLEVLNKKDESPFNQNDLELLTAFASHMAVAIENARLYTQTDQALASRLEELSTMQQIDQELNATLDIEQVMSITLEAAWRHSQAAAGWIGSNDNKAVEIIAAHGITFDGIETGTVLDPTEIPGLQADHLVSEKPVRLDSIDGNGETPVWSQIPGETDRILVPIKLDSEISGVIYLVSTQPAGFTTENLEFLTRLSDHAAIAISNAQLYAKVQAANKAKSEFVSAAAHELKNPLTSIKGYSDLLEAGSVGPVNEGQADFLRTIRTNAERMRTLVSDLQDITRIEANQLLLEIGEANIADLIQEVVLSFDSQISEKEQTIIVDAGENLPKIRCDNTRMVQVLTNLISNAHKYSPTGGRIGVKVGMAEETLQSTGEESLLQVSVSDEGYGICETDQELIFEQFFRSEDSQIRRSTGTGLGLSITKRLVELQGGKLWFESQHGKGTNFYFTIPVYDSAG